MEEKKCRLWIRRYMKPIDHINHMHTSSGLRMMMQEDTGVVVTDRQFKQIALSEGFEPADAIAQEWEFRISSAPLRRRANAEVRGWLSSRNPYSAVRMG